MKYKTSTSYGSTVKARFVSFLKIKSKVTVKFTKSLTLVSFERVSLYRVETERQIGLDAPGFCFGGINKSCQKTTKLPVSQQIE